MKETHADLAQTNLEITDAITNMNTEMRQERKLKCGAANDPHASTEMKPDMAEIHRFCSPDEARNKRYKHGIMLETTD